MITVILTRNEINKMHLALLNLIENKINDTPETRALLAKLYTLLENDTLSKIK